MNIWHDINPERIKPDNFTAVIEISKGSKSKYELDKETGGLKLDRILYTSTHSSESEICSDKLFKIVFHEILPTLRNNKLEDSDKVSQL